MRKCLQLIIVMMSVQAFASDITVCKSCEVETLKEAVAIAAPGDRILIREGVYEESGILIEKPLTIEGEEGAVLDGSSGGNLITVKTDGFTIRNLTLSNIAISYISDNSALKIVRSRNFLVEGLTLEKVFFGIHIEKSHEGIVRNNVISSTSTEEANSGNGIHIWHSSNMEIAGNTLSGMRDGIYFEFVTESEVYNNVSSGNIRYGLHFMFSNNDTYYDNTFHDNGAGVAVMFSKFITMYRNRFSKNWGSASYGLLLKEIYDTEIYDNVFEENTVGIKGEGCTRINYKNNVFLRNGWAIKIAGACYTNIFEQNDFLHNSFDLAYNSKVNDNRFEQNYWSEYTGYDLDHNGIGDIPFRPVKLFAYVVNTTPEALVLLRSLFIDIINFSEKVSPVFTPDNLLDVQPLMTPVNDFD